MGVAVTGFLPNLVPIYCSNIETNLTNKILSNTENIFFQFDEKDNNVIYGRCLNDTMNQECYLPQVYNESDPGMRNSFYVMLAATAFLYLIIFTRYQYNFFWHTLNPARNEY